MVKELLIRCRKLNICIVFITQFYFLVLKDVRLNSTHSLIMKISNRKELYDILINRSADIDYNGFTKIYRKCTNKPQTKLILNFDIINMIIIIINMTLADKIKILDDKFFMVRSRVSKSRLKVELCFHRYVHFASVPILVFGSHDKQYASD